jgi:hypothetical protein
MVRERRAQRAAAEAKEERDAAVGSLRAALAAATNELEATRALAGAAGGTVTATAVTNGAGAHDSALGLSPVARPPYPGAPAPGFGASGFGIGANSGASAAGSFAAADALAAELRRAREEKALVKEQLGELVNELMQERDTLRGQLDALRASVEGKE